MGNQMSLRIFSGGAANGLVNALADAFRASTGMTIEGDYGAVGAMRDRVLAGESVDLLILTRSIIDALSASGHVDPDSVRDLGQVATGVAVRSGAHRPALGTTDDLRVVLSAADAVYVPDTAKATAGIHFTRVLGDLGIEGTVRPRIREFPNGQTAMAAMAESGEKNTIGCTQVTEILNTPGVDYVADLPAPHALSSTYTAAVCSGTKNAEAARELIAILCSPKNEELRRKVGFTS